MLLNEVYSFQAALKLEEGKLLRSRIKVSSDLPVDVYFVENVPGSCTAREDHDDYIIDENADIFPDVLRKYDGGEILLSEYVRKNFFFEINGKKNNLTVGKHFIEITADNVPENKIESKAVFELEVLSAEAEENDLIVARWLHYDCIADKCGVVPFSESFFVAVENYIRSAVEHGHTMAYIPMFTPPLDTAVGKERRTIQSVSVIRSSKGYSFDFSDFDRLISICRKCGIRYFELSHLFTQWGAEFCPKIAVKDENGQSVNAFGWDVSSESREYADFLKSFLIALCVHLKELNIFENSYLHLSDEPDRKVIGRYARLNKLVKTYAPDLKTIDAMASYELADEGCVDLPVAELGGENDFLNCGKEFLVYYACTTYKNHYSNIFLNMPLLRTRILGVQMYLTEVKGCLHWGYNYYNSVYSLYPVDPFRETSADGYFPSGDGFVVYPDGKNVLSSLRLEAFFDGIQDYCALKALEKKLGRSRVVGLVNDYGIASNFTDYDTDENNYLNLREQVNRLLATK